MREVFLAVIVLSIACSSPTIPLIAFSETYVEWITYGTLVLDHHDNFESGRFTRYWQNPYRRLSGSFVWLNEHEILLVSWARTWRGTWHASENDEDELRLSDGTTWTLFSSTLATRDVPAR